MAEHLDFTGAVLDLSFDKGSVISPGPFTLYDGNNAAITNISSARIDFFTGTIASPTATFTNAVSVNVAASTTISFTLSATNTRAFTAGTEYCYKLEVTLSDGTIVPVLKGNIDVGTEFST